jgi:hypothetical protein
MFTFPLLFSFDVRMDFLSLLAPLFMVFLARLANFFYEVEGLKSLLKFYLFNCLSTSLVLYAFSLITHTDFVFFGPQPLFYSFIMYCLFVIPEMELLLFVIPVKARYFIWIGIGLSLFFSIESHNYISFIATLSGIIFGYLFGLKKYPEYSPFPALKLLEKKLLRFFGWFKARQKCVIVDFKTGRQLNK